MHRIRTCLLALLLCMIACATAATAYGPDDLTIPASAEAITYGTSGAGRNLMAYRFGSGKNVMVLGFALHGYEDNWNKDGGALVYTAGQVMESLDQNAALLASNDWSIYVLPCMNPDGLLDGTSNQGPGRCTTTYLDINGNLITGKGVNLNRCFPHNWTQLTTSRDFNGDAPLASREAMALAQFIQDVRGDGVNLCIDAQGWEEKIITNSNTSALYKAFEAQFPSCEYTMLSGGQGFFAAYAADLGYNACLFEFPPSYTMESFLSSGNSTRYANAILDLVEKYGTEPIAPPAPQTATVTLKTAGAGSGTVSGNGTYAIGDKATLTATPNDGSRFEGWYAASGKPLSVNQTITILVQNDTTVTAKFEAALFTVTATASRSGSVIGAGSYAAGSLVTLTAVPGDSGSFSGWYTTDGSLLSSDTTYAFTVSEDTAVYALFAGDVFADIPGNAWYLEDAMEALYRGLTTGTTSVTFSGTAPYTRAMAAVMLYRLDQKRGDMGLRNDDALTLSPFADVKPGVWYYNEVLWAYQNGIITGRGDGTFGPDESISRQDFFTMALRYLVALGHNPSPAVLPYSDSGDLAGYAQTPVGQAQALGLLRGDNNGNLLPRSTLSRAEGATFLVRIARLLQTLDAAENP